MNAKLLARTIVFLFMGIGCAMARTTIPNTPAGHVLQAWLNAFNSGNPSLIKRDVVPLNPYQSLSGLIAFRKATGGFNLLAVERSEPMHIWFLVKDKNTGRQAIGDLWVKSTGPLETRYFGVFLLPPGVSPVIVTLDSALRGRVIDGVAADLTKFYVHTAVASQMIAALRARQMAGAYRDLSDGFQFADRLTSDLRATSHDGHLFVRFQPFKAPPPEPPTAQQVAQMNEQIERGNCGFEKVEVLPGDIGYVKFNAFMLPAVCAGTIEAAMAFVAHTRALIFDLRDNHGGAPVTVAFIASYLFDRPTQLSSIHRRDQNTTSQFWTLPSLPGERLSTQPVFVLTSNSTFSGAEQFTYDLKNLRRATIVGEPTGGGAHTVNGYIVADYFLVQVPIGEAINPITHTNWEGTGVQPDVKVPAAEALNVAERLATKDIQVAAANYHREQEPARTAPSPGTEASLRRQIEGWEKGRPDYKDMGPGPEEATLQQRVRIQRAFNRLGALKALTFERVARDGWDVYGARFAHGRLQWSVAPLSPDGRVPGEFFRPSIDNGVRSPRH
jgi:hypothetical protein